jgi:hypothetical protein
MMVAMNHSAMVAENYIEKKIAVKNYLSYLDDMEHRKGQHRKVRAGQQWSGGSLTSPAFRH